VKTVRYTTEALKNLKRYERRLMITPPTRPPTPTMSPGWSVRQPAGCASVITASSS